MWMGNLNASGGDSPIQFRKYNISSSSWDSSSQTFDIPASGHDLLYPSLKEDNAPTSAPGPKLDLLYMNTDNEMSPVYTTFYHTWHTKETRNSDNPTSLPTTEALTITNTDNSLSFFYSEKEYTDSNSDDGVYSPADTPSLSTLGVRTHTFKKVNANNTNEIQISWNGKITSGSAVGCSGAQPCTLQIYQWGNSGCSAGWGDFDSGTRTNIAAAAGSEFTLTGNKTTSLSCFYSGSDADDHLGTNTVAVRVYKNFSATNGNLQTDVITFTFVPEKILWLLPLALFLPRILRKFGWKWRRKAYVYANMMPFSGKVHSTSSGQAGSG